MYSLTPVHVTWWQQLVFVIFLRHIPQLSLIVAFHLLLILYYSKQNIFGMRTKAKPMAIEGMASFTDLK